MNIEDRRYIKREVRRTGRCSLGLHKYPMIRQWNGTIEIVTGRHEVDQYFRGVRIRHGYAMRVLEAPVFRDVDAAIRYAAKTL